MQAVNPKSTKEVQVDESKFTLGIIPFGKRTEIESIGFFSSKAQTAEEVRNLVHQSYEYVRWSVKGHSGFKFEDGTEVPFSLDEKLGCVSEETMSVYAATPGMLVKLSTEVTAFNYLKKDAVKN